MRSRGNIAYATINEGLGKVLRYGAYGPAITERLQLDGRDSLPGAAKALSRSSAGST